MTKQADLIAYLFDGRPHLLSTGLLEWMEASPRFTAFVDMYRDKIRKKVRVSKEPETALDLRGELEVAYRLLDDRRLEVAYEPYASSGRRGADFAVTYRANLVFNIEVARIRDSMLVEPNRWLSLSKSPAAVETSSQAHPVEERILRILLNKLGQMQPAMPNLLVIQALPEMAQAVDLASLMQSVKLRADRKDPSLYAGSPYVSPSAFYKDFLRLNALLIWSEGVQAWANRQSRPGLEGKVLRLVKGLLGGASGVG